MKYFALTILSIVSYSARAQYLNPDVPLVNKLGDIVIVHVVSELKSDTSNVEKGTIIGRIEKYPDKLSVEFFDEIKKSQKSYNNGDYKKAMSVLEKALAAEPTNYFVLNTYARACYQIDREKSFSVYKKLILLIDEENDRSPTVTPIDIWFREAYWKLGTLYMDYKEWDKAEYEISRFIVANGDIIGKAIYIQALQYLTECAYVTYRDDLAKYMANRVLIYDPNNKYAQMVIQKLSK